MGPGGPGMAPPPPPPPYDASGGGQPDTSGNVFNIISLVGGIVSIALCCLYGGLWGGIPAIILGVIGRKKAAEGHASNGTLGTVGLILGIVGVVIFIAQVIYIASGASANMLNQLQNAS